MTWVVWTVIGLAALLGGLVALKKWIDADDWRFDDFPSDDWHDPEGRG